MAERRRLLAETARRKIREVPSHSDRIAAIREDAILAGERRTDGLQQTLSANISVGVILNAFVPDGAPRGTIAAETDAMDVSSTPMLSAGPIGYQTQPEAPETAMAESWDSE